MVGGLYSSVLLLLLFLVMWPGAYDVDSAGCLFGSIFCFDLVSCFLILLSFLLWVSLVFWFGEMSGFGCFMISLSVVSSVLCYCCVHAIWFWVFYEMSIVPLLILLVVESPYSERYIASWYLLGYVVLTSLPMLLCLFYMVGVGGGFDFRLWRFDELQPYLAVCFLLSLMFITKIPLPPFHVWLPIVHAEASSPVSVCLSGYIMKLGILGVFRFCFSLLPVYIFSKFYVMLCFFFSVLFFFSACRELDGKRWLAFMSLCHILVASGCLCLGDWLLGGLSFLYCLGHGLSAGLVFLFLWLLYNISGTRNLSVLKSGISGSLILRVVACACLCTVCSLPPTVQFFSEVFLVLEIGWVGGFLIVALYFFLFLGGLVPLFLVGTVLARHFDLVYGYGSVSTGLFSVIVLIVWSYLLFVVC